jgi:hypothetical protein
MSESSTPSLVDLAGYVNVTDLLVRRATQAPEHATWPAAQAVLQEPFTQAAQGQSPWLVQACGSPALAQRSRPSNKLQALALKAVAAADSLINSSLTTF